MSAQLAALTVFAGLPVRDLDRSIAWFGRIFAREPDGRPAPGIAEYYLAGDRVPEHGTLQLRHDTRRAGGGLVTINVADVAPITENLAALGVEFAPRRRPIKAETVAEVTVGSFEDPDGNEITIVQPHLIADRA